MLVRLPYSGDWIDPYLVVAIRVLPNDVEDFPYQLQVLATSGNEMTMFAVVAFKDLDSANAARDKTAEQVNFQRALIQQQLTDNEYDDEVKFSSTVRH